MTIIAIAESTADWKFALSIVLPLLLAVCGWIVVDQLNRRRERDNKLRDIKTDYLIKAYRYLANSSQRTPTSNSPYFREMEAAFADIQLFGSKEQVRMVAEALDHFSRTAWAPLDPIMNDVRNELRKKLHLEPVTDNVRWFRPEGAPDVASSNKPK